MHASPGCRPAPASGTWGRRRSPGDRSARCVTGSPADGDRLLAARAPREDLAPDPDLSPDTRLWAALQQVGGGTWGGCVYDADAIAAALTALRPAPSPSR